MTSSCNSQNLLLQSSDVNNFNASISKLLPALVDPDKSCRFTNANVHLTNRLRTVNTSELQDAIHTR